MITTEPTLHDLLEVSAAIGAETGKWRYNDITKLWKFHIVKNGEVVGSLPASHATPDELDAQVGRLVEQLVELGCSNDWDADGWNWIRYDNPLIEHEDYNTAVYLAACKVRDSK